MEVICRDTIGRFVEDETWEAVRLAQKRQLNGQLEAAER